MRVYTHINEFTHNNNSIITTGTFDGVHVGHQKILKRLVELSKANKQESVLLTFNPHPRIVLQKDSKLQLIQTLEEKIESLEKLGIDHLIIHPFTKEFSRTSSLDFIRTILKDKLGAKLLVIGYDHQFGRNREGSFENLKKSSSLYGFNVEEIQVEDVDNIAVSSTKIRHALSLGDIKTVNKYLTRPFELNGKVIKGNQIGRDLGFPTANIKIQNNYKILPANGVYFVDVLVNNENYNGMLNIGFRPTVTNAQEKVIEVNIFDFNKNIYDENIKIYFKDWIREEKEFDNSNELINQIKSDKKICLEKINSI